MPEHPTNLTFRSVWEEKDRCVQLLLGSTYLHRKIVKNNYILYRNFENKSKIKYNCRKITLLVTQ